MLFAYVSSIWSCRFNRFYAFKTGAGGQKNEVGKRLCVILSAVEELKPKKKSRFSSWMGKLKVRYRIVVVDDRTFDEKWSVSLSPLFLVTFFGGGAIVIITLTTLLIAYTPLREYIPGYPDGTEKQSVADNKIRLDSLEQQLNKQAAYIERIKVIMNGGVMPDSSRAADTVKAGASTGDLRKAGNDEKDFRKKVEQKESRYKGGALTGHTTENRSGLPYFYVPVNGSISQSFNPAKNHNGVDVSTAKDEPVKAALEGTVIFSGYTSDGGYEMHIQHMNDLVTIYKHNNYLFKQTGQRVRAGETVAIAGNTGEQSKGTHLHFEIWDNGLAVDPETYVGF